MAIEKKIKEDESRVVRTEKGIKFLCTENDNTIEYKPEDEEFYIGHESGAGGWWVIGKKDLINALKEFGISTE